MMRGKSVSFEVYTLQQQQAKMCNTHKKIENYDLWEALFNLFVTFDEF
jgi:hypothetical protein